MGKKVEQQIKEWVTKNYIPSTTSWTSERSFGNYDDCFEDGEVSATSWNAWEIGKILGMELEEPDGLDDEDF